jgi:diadenylate cyclase
VTVADFFRLLSWRDLVDVLLVALLVYMLLLRIRGTRAVQVLVGILLVGGVFWLARSAGLVTLETILEKFLIVLPFAILVLFQQEIRRALANMGSNPFPHLAQEKRTENAINEVVVAAHAMASRRIGALIVLERQAGLRDFVEGGVVLDAELTSELLSTLFAPDTPLHDGAVIVRRGRIAAAACLLPLSTDPALSADLGTRHRAALGVSEETDAVAIAVSEESGEISLAYDGQLVERLDPRSLRNLLYKLLITDLQSARGARPPAAKDAKAEERQKEAVA